jgi:hypothetical protein
MVRLFLIAGVAGVLMLAAWSGVYAAKGASENNGNSIFSNVFFSKILGVNASNTEVSTETPDIVETPQIHEDNQGQDLQNATPEATEAPQVGEDHQGSDNQGQGTSQPETNGEVKGTITALDVSTITIDGVVYNLTNFSEEKGTLQVGDTVQLEFTTNPDGTLTVREVKPNNDQNNSGDSNNSNNNNSGDDHHGGSKSGGNSNNNDNKGGGSNGGGSSNGGHGGGDGGSDG